MAKKREEIPSPIAAQVQFDSDRKCCVCRLEGKPIQIHHIDEDPKNNSIQNLAVLCFDCHRETQLTGGFDRKLDSDQIILYRDNWCAIVREGRNAERPMQAESSKKNKERIGRELAIAEKYRVKKDYFMLALHYNRLNSNKLRDKYIELAVKKGVPAEDLCYLRHIQQKMDLVPKKIINAELKRMNSATHWHNRARLLSSLGRYREASRDYICSIMDSLDKDLVFSAAYYIKELYEEGVVDELFKISYADAEAKGDIWWQMRALQELGWYPEVKQLLLKNRIKIESSEDKKLKTMLKKALGEEDEIE
jgi:tetratricopeptide (TPR) repeat protein